MAVPDYFVRISRPGAPEQAAALPSGSYKVGRDKTNQLVLNDPTVSWEHATLTLAADGVRVADHESTTGTYVDGNRVNGSQTVELGQKILIGSALILVEDRNLAQPEAPASTPTPVAATTPTPAPAPASHPAPAPTASASVPATPPPPASEEENFSVRKRGRKLSRDAMIRQQVKVQVHQELLDRLDLRRMTAENIGESDLQDRARELVDQIISDVRERLPAGIDPNVLAREIYNEAVKLGPLEDYLADDTITEIMVNGHNRIYIERAGNLDIAETTFVNNASVLAIIERIVSPIGRRIDESRPYVDARLPDGSRVNAIIHPLALDGPSITIRKFSKKPFTVSKLVELGALTENIAEFIDVCVKARKNLIVSGGTGTGKTTFLNVVSNYIPDTERIITVEDAAELRLPQDHVIRLEARPANIEGTGAITIRDLVRNALRMRPDRIVVGECRGGEALDMLQAMNTGHEGSITTVHANSPRDVISRLETMVLMSGMELPVRAIREQIGSAIQMIVHLGRFQDGSRKVSKVTEICGMEGDKIVMQDLFEFKREGLSPDGKVLGRLVPTGNVPTFLDEIRSRGLKLNPSVFDPAMHGGVH